MLVMTFTNISFFPHYGSYLVSSDGLESAELLLSEACMYSLPLVNDLLCSMRKLRLIKLLF